MKETRKMDGDDILIVQQDHEEEISIETRINLIRGVYSKELWKMSTNTFPDVLIMRSEEKPLEKAILEGLIQF